MNSLKVVLIEPEIPQNTGNIGRLCLATGSELHLVEPLGFSIDAREVKRAGLDYWEHVNLTTHKSLDEFLRFVGDSSKIVLFTKKSGTCFYDYPVPDGAWLVFGRETFGLPESLLSRFARQSVRLPIFDARVRSLNLANAVSISVYEALRQQGRF